MNFRPGQKIKCVNSNFSGDALVEGNIYTVKSVFNSKEASIMNSIILQEIPEPSYWYSHRFVCVLSDNKIEDWE